MKRIDHAPFVIPTPKTGPFVLGPDSHRQPGVPVGSLTKAEWRSTIFPGTVRDWWIYVPAQYTSAKPAAVMIFQDGSAFVHEEGKFHAHIVFDNLIHQGRMPVTIGLFIDSGHFPPVAPGQEPIYNRSFEYDTLSDQFPRFLIEEMLPEVGRQYNLTQDPDQRAICGGSSGGICAFNAAWERPDFFRKVLSYVGSFADIRGGHVYPTLIRKTPPKPIRVYLQAGSADLNCDWGNWTLANLEMASALQFAQYDYHLEYTNGNHDPDHMGVLLPEALTWLWR